MLEDYKKNKPAKTAKEKTEETEELSNEEGEINVETFGEIKVNIQRYKGLGEMNPDQLWDTTMDPAKRKMKKISVDDVGKADETFDILMGSDVAPRKRFIQTHAKNVKNLDI
jgi:DNA gyrase subunit B